MNQIIKNMNHEEVLNLSEQVQILQGPPYFTDRSASWGAAMTSATQENRPPRTEDMVTQPRAFSALPALAMA